MGPSPVTGLALLRRAGWRLLLAGLLGAGTELAGIGLAGTAAFLIARAAEHPPLVALALAIGTVRALAFAKGGLRYAERLAGHDAALRVLAEVRTRAYAALQAGAPVATRGDALARLVSDVDGVQDALLRWLVPAAVAGAVGTAAVGFVAWVAPAAGAVLAAGLLAGGVLLPWLGHALSRPTLGRLASARGGASAATVDVVHGAADLTAYGALPAALAAAGDRAAEVARLERGAGLVTAVVGGLAAAVPGLTAVAVALTGSGVKAAVLALVALTAVEAAAPLAAAAVRHAELRGALSRVGALLAAAPAGSTAPAGSAAESTVKDSAPVTTVPHLRLEGVTVSYRDGGPPALDGLDLDLAPGRRVAVIGPSGSGKSTLLAALSGQVPLAGGALTVDGAPGVPTGWPVTGGVFADAHVFHATVRENLTLGRTHLADADLARGLVAAGLPDWTGRLDDLVGEDGARLSGGQRQRLLLARVLAEPPPVLLLDEPTEGLDPAAADAVLADALRAAGTSTMVVVTHRYTGLAEFDEVVALDGGRRGQPPEISALRRGPRPGPCPSARG